MESTQLLEAHQAFELYLSFNSASDRRLIGMFERQENGSYVVKDIRMSDFSRIEQYKVKDSNGNESEPKEELNITFFADNSFAPKDSCYYYFDWKYTDNNPDNLCEITIDLSVKIEMLTPYDIITLLYNAQMNLSHGSAKTNNQMLDTLTKQLTASGEEVFIYELLQNANDYPFKKGQDVDVEIKLTNNYLLFRHTGAEFTPKNVAALCNANDKDKTANPDAIGYKGIGFKTVFNHNNYVYLTTGGFSFRYDSEIKKKKGGIPWKVTPIWMEPNELDAEYGKIFEHDRDKFRVQFAMRPIKHEILWEGNNSFLAILKRLFVDETKILFIPNLGKVNVYLDSSNTPTFSCSRKSANWCLSEVFENDVDEEITKQINKELEEDEENETSRIPVKYKDFKKTGVSFACKVNGRKLVLHDNAIMYCYLPAEQANWGFKFYMNSDMIPNGPRSDIEHNLELNNYLAENAGKMFYRWIRSLVESGNYDYDSIFALVPNFDYCKQRRPVNQGFVGCFQKGFESCLDRPLVPTADGTIVPIKDIIWDETYLTCSDVLTDEQFFEFTGRKGFLPHPSLRRNNEFKRFITNYLRTKAKDNIYDFPNLKIDVQNDSFQDWLLISGNNGKFINYLLSTPNNQIKEFSELPIYINNTGELGASNTMYYAGDNIKQALVYLSPFISYFPYLSFDLVNFFKSQTESSWSKVWPSLGFKQFGAADFVTTVLFAKENKENVISLLKILDTSVNFFRFLAANAKDNFGEFNFSALPFINSDGEVMDSFSEKLVFYEDAKGKDKAVLKEKWFNPAWAYFISDAYTKDDKNDLVWKFLLGKNLLKLFDVDTVIKQVLSVKENYDYIRENTRDNIPASVSFVHYIFNNKHHLMDGVDYKVIPLSVSNLKNERSFEICNDISVFPYVDARYTKYSWLDSGWIYKIDSAYYTGIAKTDEKGFNEFLQTKFGLKFLSDKSFYFYIVKKNRADIAKKIFTDKALNKDFYAYLASILNHDYIKQENLATVYEDMPFINSKGEMKKRASATKGREYWYDTTLSDLADATWVSGDAFSVVNKLYDFTGAKDLFLKLGFKEYNDANFGSFFVSVLKPYLSISEHGNCSDFHHYMSGRLSQLNDEQKTALKSVSCYIFSKTGSKLYNTSTGLYIPESNLDITNEIIAGELPEYKAIDKGLCDTKKMIEYWEAIGNERFTTSACNKWLKSNYTFIEPKISTNADNIRFWRWVKGIQKGNLSYNLYELSGFKLLQFSHRDENGYESSTESGTAKDVYMSNLYHQGIEAFANRYGNKKYVSELYVEDPTNNKECEEWRNFFKQVGVKDDVKDVIRQIIENDLTTLEDEHIPNVLVDQFQSEIDAEWDTMKNKLVSLRVKLKNTNDFAPIADVVIIDPVVESTSEPMPYLPIPMESAASYMENTEVAKLIRRIAEVAGTKIIRQRSDWMHEKVNAYIAMQNSISIQSSQLDIHLQFIEDFAGVYEHNYPNWGFDNEAKLIKLFNKNGELSNPSQLTLGHAYNPFCDFEGNGVVGMDKEYISELYAKLTNRRILMKLFDEVFKVQMVFVKSDLKYLAEKRFCAYFWKKFLPSDEVPQNEMLTWVQDEALKGEIYIINKRGEVCKPEFLYSMNISDYVEKKVRDWERKMPDVSNKGKMRDILNEMRFKGALDFIDCLENLLNTTPQGSNRPIVLGWIASSYYKEEYKGLVETYRKSDKAMWVNGKKKPAHISTLYALSNKDNKRISVFRTDEHIIDYDSYKNSISTENWFAALKYLGVPVLSDNSLQPECPIEKVETALVLPIIKLRLLALIASRQGTEWRIMYTNAKYKLNNCKFNLCSSIAYRYKELLSNQEKFYYKDFNYYYIKSWQSKQVFTRLVTELNEYLNLPYDINAINDILDFDEYSEKGIVDFINHNCADLFEDELFVKELDSLSSGIKSQLDIHDKLSDELPSVEEEDKPIATISGEEGQKDDVYNPYHKDKKGSDHTQFGSKKDSSEDNTDNKTASDDLKHPVEPKMQTPVKPKDESANKQEAKTSTYNPQIPEEYEDCNDNSYTCRLPEDGEYEEDDDSEDIDDNPIDNGYGAAPINKALEPTSGADRSKNTGTRREGIHQTSSDVTYNPLDEIASSKAKEAFDTNDAEANEQELAHNEELFRNGLSRAEIADQNTLVKTRMYNSFADEGLELEMSEVDFIRYAADKREYGMKTKSGKYLHVVSAYGGIMYLSPVFWNRVQRKNCVVCVVLSHKARNFKYIRSREDLEKIIGGDELVVRVSGHNKIDLVNELFGKRLHNAIHKVYTMLRVKTGTGYDMLFKPHTNEWDEEESNNNDL